MLLRFTGIVKRQYVRMVQLSRDLDFAMEAFRSKRRRKLRAEDLYCDLALVLQVLGEVDRRMSNRNYLTLAGRGGFRAVGR